MIWLLLALLGSAQAQTIVIDDQDGAPGFTTTGNDWTTWNTNGYGFDGGDSSYHYLSHTVGGNDRVGTATWTPTLPTAGTWQISTWFRMTENRTPDADHVITDGAGGATTVVLNQIGEGASGWVDLGSYWCAQGWGGCSVTLDGTDDNHSDEANAVRFVLVSPDPNPVDDDDAVADDDDAAADPCDEFPGLGDHVQVAFAGSVSGLDWSDLGQAEGEADGAEAHTANVDAGEFLAGAGFPLCDPLGDDVITGVEIAARGRTQYASGPYDVLLNLDAGGAGAVWHGTSLAWRTVDVTLDQGAWTWAEAASLVPTITLNDQPGGNRDSDAWVDAFRVRVWYTTSTDPFAADDDDVVLDDDDVVVDDDDAVVDDDDVVADDDDVVVDDDDVVADDDDVVVDDDDDVVVDDDDDVVDDDDDDSLAAELPAPGEPPSDPAASGGCWQSVDGAVAGLILLPLWGRGRGQNPPLLHLAGVRPRHHIDDVRQEEDAGLSVGRVPCRASRAARAGRARTDSASRDGAA